MTRHTPIIAAFAAGAALGLLALRTGEPIFLALLSGGAGWAWGYSTGWLAGRHPPHA